jgi:hypothetical protein
MSRLGAQQDDYTVHWDVILLVKQGVIRQNVDVLPGGSTGLKVDVDDLLQRFANSNYEIGRCCDR